MAEAQRPALLAEAAAARSDHNPGVLAAQCQAYRQESAELRGRLADERARRRRRPARRDDVVVDEDARALGGIDLPTIQKWINHWYGYSLDLFGAEVSTNAADYFASGVKGRWRR